MRDPQTVIAALAVAGLVGGLVLLARGLRAYRAGEPVRGTSTSRIASLAAGEVRLVGTIEAGPVTLVSPLQSEPCVWYRARVTEQRGRDRVTTLDEQRAVGFRLRDASGTIRLFPRGASFDAPAQLHAATDWMGSDPPGLRQNVGPTSALATPEDREAAIARLLTVQRPPGARTGADGPLDGDALALLSAGAGEVSRQRTYEEHRLAPGDLVTIVGTAMPFSDIGDPVTADSDDPLPALDDPEVAMNVAEARAAGLLKGTPEEAWGNAAIPGFGIGRPTRAPDLDPEANPEEVAPASEEARVNAEFDIPPGELVLARASGATLMVRSGSPGEAVARDQSALLLGLGGGILAIAAALTLAFVAQGGRW